MKTAHGGRPARARSQTLNLDKGKKVSPFTIPALLGNTASGITGIELGALGMAFEVWAGSWPDPIPMLRPWPRRLRRH